MSWVQHKKPLNSSSLTSANASSSPSNTNAFSTNTTLSYACQPLTNTAQLSPQTLLMTSQYTPLISSSTAAMHLNQTSPYQPLAPQQLLQQQSTLSQRHHQQQQQPQQHQVNNALQQPTSQVSLQTASTNSTASQMQGVFNNGSQQQSSWPTQPVGYLPIAKMTPPPPDPSATLGTSDNWPQQNPQHIQQNFQNANMYQQNAPAPAPAPAQPQTQQQQQWPQNLPATYDNYYQQQQTNNNMYQPQLTAQTQQHVSQQNPTTYFQQQPSQTATQTNPMNFFDQSNNNNQTATADGWGDWDWSDNSALSATPAETNAQAQQQPQPQPQSQPLNQQQPNLNTSLLADSFNTQNNNNSWTWDGKENEQQFSNKEDPRVDNTNPANQNTNLSWSPQTNQQENHHQPEPVPTVNDKHNDNWNWQATNENQQNVIPLQSLPEENNIPAKVSQMDSSPPPPPPMEFSSAASENHNYNTNITAAPPNNIPSTVFVTQAKPVTLPSRQYASPPSGNTPIMENPPETALMPPQGFQNVEESNQRPNSVVALPLATSTAAPPTAANPPPLAGMPTAANKSANPFKRSGVAQHHRVPGLLATSTASASVQVQDPTIFNMPPPPPADFANPGAVTVMEPDNNELPSQENQEVLTFLTTQQISLPSANIQTSGIAAPHPPPPNDERNQYLQTSHLSENLEEQQPEIDGLLPPPGLSRLVLGEPELEASQQRMVMGTESTNADNSVTQAAVMHLEERHADGEDTASENALPVNISIGQGVTSTSSTLSSDRNLYLVPGESNSANNNNQQRVVTGVELAEQREIEMDGENLEDEQVHQQQQHQQHQHQQHHAQNQHQHLALSAEARNEPPVEGADDTVAPPSNLNAVNLSHSVDQHQDQPHHHASNQLAKIKDSQPISSPNDDDDSDERLLNDRGMNQSIAGSSKSRTKYGNERLAVATRRRDKRSSVERYESDEYINSEGEYSSDREERERKERDRRRNYREGSVRSDRGVNEDDDKRSRGHRTANKRDKYYEGGERTRGDRDERERERGVDRSKAERRSLRQRGYDNDSRYETEESTRFDSRKDPLRRSTRRADRGDQAAHYDDYNRRAAYRSSKRPIDNYESDRRDRRRSDKHRDPRYREEPRYDPREYEDYRKHSSRNARESDMEKEAAVPSRSGRMHHDPRHAAAMYGYPSSGYYDPYAAYYYQQMARTNPTAYAEWYKKYYGQAAGVGGGASQSAGVQGAPNAINADTSLPTSGNDGRESVHSGRSSAHNDIKDRYTHAYITQANDYHRHYQQQQHLHQQQHFHQQQQQQQLAFNQSLNSTMLDEEHLKHNTSMFSGLGNLSLARSNTNLSQIHGGYYIPTTTGPSSVAGVYYARSDYAESRSGALSLRDHDPIAQEPQRLTPCKFITEHTVVNFASGILVTVKPKYTPNGSICNVVKLLKFKPNDETRKLFKVFPGPLVRGLTHKKTVIEFCQEQIRLGPLETTIYAKQLITNNAEKYRGSYTLMWNLLILLLKQNGMVVGTDIAELLLKNQQQFPYQTPSTTANTSLKSKSGSNSPIEELDITNKDTEEPTKPANPELTTAGEEKLQEDEDLDDNSLTKSSSNSVALTEVEITEKFRNYLLYGNVSEALEWATDNNLWGHALFLASKLDRRSHANIMMKFANKLCLNDPLQTLYQLMSGRTPSSVTCVQDEKWGDWRPHLSMILSNTSQKPELDRKAITTLGDSLCNRGDLYAAHFCYLMAQVGFGRYQETATQETSLQQHLPKLVLLGSSHYKHFKDFANNEAIIMTEIYEYACSLNDDKFSIVEFQPYKFLLATRLLDYGFHLKSLMYLEQIAVHIARDANKYESSFINKVYEMADRLKYYDPVLEKTIDDQQPVSDDNTDTNLTSQQLEEQKWLQNLRQLAQQYKNDFSTSATITSTSIAQDPQQPHVQDPVYYNQQHQIDQQFMEINKQFSELNLQYQQATTENKEHQQQPMFYSTEQQQQQQLDAYQRQQQQLQQDPLQTLPTELTHQSATAVQQPGEPQLTETVQQPQFQQTDVNQTLTGFNSSYYDPSQYNAVDAGGSHLDNQPPANYDYWQQQPPLLNQTAEENARPTISMPKSRTYDTDDDNSNKILQQQHTGNEASKKQQQAQQLQQKGAKKEDANKNQQHGNQNSGWFGGIWNKFSLKPKNQMILPDDKNPAIVWDPEKKKWVNTDGDEDEQEALKPPPKMSDLMPQQPQPQPQQPPPHMLAQQQQQLQTQTNQVAFIDPQQQPQLQQYVPNSMPQTAPSPNPLQQQQMLNQSQTQAPAPAKTPTLQSNMFKMQRNRTLKNAYVDVFNPSGAPVNKAAENILAPALPPAAVPQSGFFIPGGSPSGQEQQYQQQQPQQQDTPQFYNPNQFSSGSGY